MPPTPRQTKSFLMRRFAEVGIHPKSRHGQNFLIDLNLLELLAATAQVDHRDVVLEVGTGTGSLTAIVARQAAAVVSVEVDPQMHQLASEELVDFDNVTLLHQDALRNKNNLRDNVIEAVEQRLAEGPDRRFKLVANLPYNVATPILSNLLSTRITPVTMTATIQKELAERIVAAPGTKDYSALSIWMQSQCDAEIVRIMPPSAFWPRPKVHSAIIQIVVNPARRAALVEPAFFHQFVRNLFLHRRKFLRGVLVATYGPQLGKPGIDRLLAELGFGETTRAEELDVATIQRLSETFRAALAATATE